MCRGTGFPGGIWTRKDEASKLSDMMARTLWLCLLSSVLVIAPPASAQVQENCRTLPEGIIRLRPYSFDTAMQWDAIYGVAGKERFETALVLESGNVVAGGALWPRNDPQNAHGLLAELDRRGKTVWENRHDKIRPLTIRKILFRADGKGYIAAGTLAAADQKTDPAIRIGWYGLNGALEREMLLVKQGYALSFEDMILPLRGEGLVVVANAADRAGRQTGIAWRLNAAGEKVWERRYDSGSGSRFLGVSSASDGVGNSYYIVTGSVETGQSRTVGLVMKLDAAGTLMWQKEYPRGVSATLRSAASYGMRDVIVTGDSEPYGDRYGRSAWAMRLSAASGEPVWQRYFAIAGHRLHGRDAVAVADGRASLLVDVEKIRSDKETGDVDSRDMARVLTLSPRGEILRDEAYLAGTGAHGNALVLGPGQHRLVAGYAVSSHKADDRSNEANFQTEDGWVAMGSSLEPYRDPCLPSRKTEE